MLLHVSTPSSLLLIALMFVLYTGFILFVAHHVRSLFARTGSPERAMYRYNMLSKFGTSILMFVVVLGTTILIMPHLKIWMKGLGEAGQAAAVIVPFLSVILLTVINQLIAYPVVKEIRGTTDTQKEQMGTLFKFLGIILGPMLVFFLLLNFLPASWEHKLFSGQYAGILLPLLFIVAVSLLSPVLMKRALKAKPMEDGELKKGLEQFARQAGLGSIRLYVWPATKNKTANAMVYGLRRKSIMMSDYLIQNCTPEQIQAILAHEIGHAKRYHLWIRLLLILLWVPTVMGVAQLGDRYAPEAPTWVQITTMVGLLLIYFGFTLRYVYRVQERQADAYVIKLGLQPHVFISALFKLAKLNMMVMKFNKVDEKLQTHPSFARRIRWLADQAGISDDELAVIQEESVR